MNRIFAVLFFVIFLTGCTKKPHLISEVATYSSALYKNSIYSTAGNFDRDSKEDPLYITKANGDYYLTIAFTDRLIQKKLTHPLDNFQINIVDINSDNIEDIIITITEKGCQSCYAYRVNSKINLVLSPEYIQKKFLEQYATDSLSLECFNSNINGAKIYNSSIELYYTELDYIGKELVFISEGSISNKNNKFDIEAVISLDSQNNLHIRDVKINNDK